MTMLASLQETKARLRYDHSAEDADLTLLIESASAMVLSYLKVEASEYVGSESEEDDQGRIIGVPDEVRAATIYLVGVLSRDRDGAESRDWVSGYLPTPVLCMLYPLRTPTAI